MDMQSEKKDKHCPPTVDGVFEDFSGRRLGFIKALTKDVNEFYQQCDPEREPLCLYAFPNGEWEVRVPMEDVPLEIPKTVMGINYAKKGMTRKEWLSLVADHSHCWAKLFEIMLELPTVYEAVFGEINQRKEKSDNASSRKTKWSKKKVIYIYTKQEERPDGEEAQGASLCGACGRNYVSDK